MSRTVDTKTGSVAMIKRHLGHKGLCVILSMTRAICFGITDSFSSVRIVFADTRLSQSSNGISVRYKRKQKCENNKAFHAKELYSNLVLWFNKDRHDDTSPLFGLDQSRKKIKERLRSKSREKNQQNNSLSPY